MQVVFDYYETPPQELFDEMKKLCIEVFEQEFPDSHPNYREEKLGFLNGLQNFSDNIWCMLSRYDLWRQRMVYERASEQLKARMDCLIASYQDDSITLFFKGKL